MAFHPGAIANEFLRLADREGRSITPMQLIKLVYLAHGWHFAVADEPLINEMVEAWQYGPVVPSLYHEFKEFGRGPVRRPYTYFDRAIGSLCPLELEASDCGPDQINVARRLVNHVWDAYKDKTGTQLSSLTHRSGSPWSLAKQRSEKAYGCLMRGVDIDPLDIRDHYRRLWKERSHNVDGG